MRRLVILPVVGLVHVLDGVLADLDRHLVAMLHQELRSRGPRAPSPSPSRSPSPSPSPSEI